MDDGHTVLTFGLPYAVPMAGSSDGSRFVVATRLETEVITARCDDLFRVEGTYSQQGLPELCVLMPLRAHGLVCHVLPRSVALLIVSCLRFGLFTHDSRRERAGQPAQSSLRGGRGLC